MFTLQASITLKRMGNEFVNKEDVSEYLEYICAKFANESIDNYEVLGSNKKCFNMKCNIHKNKISCCINCNSYEKALQIAQGILKLDVSNFLDYKFEVNSLKIEETEELDMNDSSVNY
jgi:hypothetical protein